MIGLAADALGLGRFALAAALLARLRSAVAADMPARLRLRSHWVAAELGMVSGNHGAAARHAEQAAELATGYPSVRHRVKSDVVLAAALCSTGDVGRARAVAEGAFAEAEQYGLIPLRWALACILADIGGNDDAAAVRDACARVIVHRGGVWRH